LFKNLKLSFILSLVLGVNTTYSSSLDWDGDIHRNVQRYMDVFRDFRYRTCPLNAESRFDQLLKKYRGEGFWIPEFKGDVDIEAIQFILPRVKQKLAWIKNQKMKVQGMKNLSTDPVMKISRDFQLLMSLKKNELSNDEKLKTKSRQESLNILTHLQKDFKEVIDKYSFFTNFQFPVDHLKNRKVYDMVRDLEDDASKRYANKIFLQRKIFEDGTYLKDQTQSDIYFRTTMDTLYFELQEHDFYLTESARYDLEFILDKMSAEIGKGKGRILERLTEWEQRTEKFLSFYEELIQKENMKLIVVNGKSTTINKELIQKKNQASSKLKDYVYAKQAEVYKYWLSKTELERAVFVIETILMNEVGSVDGEDALERMDVARVVLNRLHQSKYGQIKKSEFIYPYIKSVTQESKIESEKWLNLLFKQGEFSFTYYYMAGASKIFCPDLTPQAKRLRNQNIEIAYLVLKEGKTRFQTTRYFSRASMIGRIHMDSIWEDYKPFPERAGLMVKGQEKLRDDLVKGDFIYLYSFRDPENRDFRVVKIKNQSYAVSDINGVQVFYQHRNPHFFRYFTKIEG
jgi:hypothetical protein